MSENKESVDCVRHPYPTPTDSVSKPGDFCWGPENLTEGDGIRYLYIHLPGIGGKNAIRVHRGAPGGERCWGWDGNEDKPTLTPSLHWVGTWHGHLVKGRLVSC